MGKFSKTHRRTKKRGGTNIFKGSKEEQEEAAAVYPLDKSINESIKRSEEEALRQEYASEMKNELEKNTNKVNDPRWQGDEGMQFKNLGPFEYASSRLIEGMPNNEDGNKGDRITVKVNKKPTSLLKNSEGKWMEIGSAKWNRTKKAYQGGSPLTEGGKRRRKSRRNKKKKTKKTHHKKPKKSRRKKHNTRRKRRH